MRMFFTVALLARLAMAEAGSGNPPVDEYQVKAAFLFNFAKFVEWPPQSFKSASDPILICVAGANPFGRSLEEAIGGKSVDGRKLAIRPISDLNQASGCHIVFMASAPRKHALQDDALAGILTVGESEGFAAAGGVIEFKLDGGKIKLEINVDAAERRQLRISSKLLSLAKIVKGPGN